MRKEIDAVAAVMDANGLLFCSNNVDGASRKCQREERKHLPRGTTKDDDASLALARKKAREERALGARHRQDHLKTCAYEEIKLTKITAFIQ